MLDQRQAINCARRVIEADRRDFFGDYMDDYIPDTLVEDSMMAFPPIFGSQYNDAGLLILSINPGEGKTPSGERTEEDALLFPALEAFKTSSNSKISSSYSKLVKCHNSVIKKWSIFGQHIAPVLAAAKRDMEKVVYCNVLPFRCRDNKYPTRKPHIKRIIPPCIDIVVRPLIDVCRPSLVVFLGVQAQEWAGDVVRAAGIEQVCWSRQRAHSAKREQSKQECILRLRDWGTWQKSRCD